MAEAAWARVGVRVVGERLRAADIAARLERENESGTDALWTVDVGAAPDPLMDQLDQAKAFLWTHQAELVALSRECEVKLLVSWSPRSPQDGIGLDPELIALLASVNGYLLLDTYLD
jgi:hypothetical protein